VNGLIGEVFPLPKMSGFVPKVDSLSGNVGAKTINIGGKPYDGSYIVTPKVHEQKLETKGAVMNEDVTVRAIPFFNVENQGGGSTAYIGSEV
jgi:hypothetical protein